SDRRQLGTVPLSPGRSADASPGCPPGGRLYRASSPCRGLARACECVLSANRASWPRNPRSRASRETPRVVAVAARRCNEPEATRREGRGYGLLSGDDFPGAAHFQRIRMTISSANKITGANAGGPRRLRIRTRWAARVAQFGRSTAGLLLKN